MIQPAGTKSYQVKSSDTLSSVAARFETTPSELAKLNRLPSRCIFPGQTIFVPNRGGEAASVTSGADTDDGNDLSSIPSASPRKRGSSSTEPDSLADRECLQKFLKIAVRHITDGQGVVTGVLLVTPNAVMFDPNVSDPLVIENGAEAYGVIAPMQYVVNTAIYKDIARMKTRERKCSADSGIEDEIYYPPEKEGGTEEEGVVKEEEPDNAPPKEPPVRRETVEEVFSEASQLTEEEPPNDENQEPPSEEGPPSEQEQGPPSEQGRRQEKLQSKEGSVDSASGDMAPPPVSSSANHAVLPGVHSFGSTGGGADSPGRQAASNSPGGLHGLMMSLNPAELLRKVGSEDALNAERKGSTEDEGTTKQKVLKRLSHPLQWMESLASDASSPPAGVAAAAGVGSNPSLSQSPPSNSGNSSSSNVFTKVSNVFTRMSSQEGPMTKRIDSTKSEPPTGGPKSPSKISYRSMVSMEDMPDLFTAIDKLMPKPSQAFDDPPMYLCLRMGKPKGERIPRKVPLMSYGKRRICPEYWFSVPKRRTEDLYRFLLLWLPQCYGELNVEELEGRGLEVIDPEQDVLEESTQDGSLDEEGHKIPDLKESWEMIKAPYTKLYSTIRSKTPHFSMESAFDFDFLPSEGPSNKNSVWWQEVVSASEDEVQVALHGSNTDDGFIPDMVGESEILDLGKRKHLIRAIPARCQGYPWRLCFSTSRDGFSLGSLYRKLEGIHGSILLLVRDVEEHAFGALMSDPPSTGNGDHFYGTGESFLFSFSEENFRLFKWTGENDYFFRCLPGSIAIGAGDGHFGLFLDENLYQGHTARCRTFNNELLTGSRDFVIQTVECWSFDL